MNHPLLSLFPARIALTTIVALSLGCGTDTPDSEPGMETMPPAELPDAVTDPALSAPEPVPTAPRNLTTADRIEVYAMVLREVLGGETESRGGVVVDPGGLADLSDLQQREVLVGIEALAPGAFFGTREEVLELERDRAEKSVEEQRRARDEKKQKGKVSSGSSTAQSSVSVNPVIEEEGAPTLVLSLKIEAFDADHAVITGNAWHSEIGDRTNRYEITWRKDRWRLKVSGPEVIE